MYYISLFFKNGNDYNVLLLYIINILVLVLENDWNLFIYFVYIMFSMCDKNIGIC